MALAVPAITISAQTNIRDSVNLTPVVITASHSPKALKDAPVVGDATVQAHREALLDTLERTLAVKGQ